MAIEICECQKCGAAVPRVWNEYENVLESRRLCKACFGEVRGYVPHPALICAGRDV